MGTLPYSRRPDLLNLTTLEERQIRGDLIESFKVISGLADYGLGLFGMDIYLVLIWYQSGLFENSQQPLPSRVLSTLFNETISFNETVSFILHSFSHT